MDVSAARQDDSVDSERTPLLYSGVPPSSSRVVEAGLPIKNQEVDSFDEGVQAWLQVVGSFFLMFNSWGIVNSYGAFQTYYKTSLFPTASPSTISWIGSTQASLLLFISVGTGPAFDAGYFPRLLWTGTALMVLGTLATSFCTQYWQFILAQALCVGLGAGCLFVPGVAILSMYFKKRASFATGIATSGSSLGGMVYTFAFNGLLPRFGFAWTVRALALIMLLTQSISLLVMRVRFLPSKRRRLFDLAAFREPPFTLYSVSVLFAFMGMYVPFFYMTSFAFSRGILAPGVTSFLLVVLNIGSLVGRIVPNFLADRTGPFNMLIPCGIAVSALAFLWIIADSGVTLYILALLYGFFSGACVSLAPTTVLSLSPSLDVVGTRMGMSFVFAALGLFTGNPIAGAILTASGWLNLQLFCGVMTTSATLGWIAARTWKAGCVIRAKV